MVAATFAGTTIITMTDMGISEAMDVIAMVRAAEEEDLSVTGN